MSHLTTPGRSGPLTATAFAATCLTTVLCSVAFALTPEDCTFYAPFDGGFDAAQASGSAKAAVKGDIRFDEGIRGQGILVGAPETGLSYETAGNLDLEAGSVSVWVKPETWDDTDAAMRFFFGVSEGTPTPPQDGGTFLWLYRFFSKTTYFLAWDSRGYPTVCPADQKQFPDVFKRGEWTHLMGTWSGDEMCLYVNGKLQSRCRTSTPRILRSLAPQFTVGDPNRANAADTVLDELRLFRRALTPPEAEALYQFTLNAEPAQQELRVVRLPGVNKLRVDVNALAVRPSEAAGLKAQLALKTRGGEAAIREAVGEFADSQHIAVELDTAGLEAGDYSVTSALMRADTVLTTGRADCAINPPPAWLGSQVGITDRVPEPWTPVEMDATRERLSLECLGPRRYAWRDAPLPSELFTAGRSILAGPMSLTGEVNGAPLDCSETVTDVERETPGRVSFTSTAAHGGVTTSASGFLEYDGLLWVRLKLAGQGPLNVTRLSLEVPLTLEAATLMQTGFGNEDAGAVKRWSHRAVAQSQVWLGNEDGGLQVTLPSARDFRNADRNRQLEIVPEEKRVVLRINFVDKPTTFGSGVEYELGMQLTPVKPHPRGWRMWRITPLQETPGTRFIPFYTEGWCQGTSYPIPKPDWAKIFSDETAKGNLATPYMQPCCIWSGMPDFGDFAAEWRTQLSAVPPPQDSTAPPMSFMGVCPRPKSWSDYFVDTWCRLWTGEFKDVGWGAMYFDVTPCPTCDNADHGCGWRDEYGVRQSEQRYLEQRDLQRRFYLAMKERWPEKPLFNHESGCLNMMQLSFTEGMVDGEHLCLALPPDNYSYAKILPLDRVRAEYMGHNFGFVPIFLPEFTRAGEGNKEVCARLMTDPEPPEVMHLLGLMMLHDILPWDAYSNPTPYFHWWAVQDAFGWGDEVEWLPYWRTAELVSVTPADPNVVCTLYRRPGKVMLVVMNNTDEERDVTIQLHPQALGLPSLQQGSLLDAWKAASFRTQGWELDPATGQARRIPDPVQVTGIEERVPLEQGKVTVRVAKRSFRVLVGSEL